MFQLEVAMTCHKPQTEGSRSALAILQMVNPNVNWYGKGYGIFQDSWGSNMFCLLLVIKIAKNCITIPCFYTYLVYTDANHPHFGGTQTSPFNSPPPPALGGSELPQQFVSKKN